MGVDPECRDKKSAAPAASRDHADQARPNAFDPAAEQRSRRTKEYKLQGVRPGERADLPVVRRFVGDADGPAQGQPENTEAISHADAEVNGERGRRHPPAIEIRASNGAFSGEQVHC